MNEIYSRLCGSGCLTDSQKEKLRSRSVRTYEKIDDLMAWMPAKGGSWFADFVEMLKQTKSGTGHSTIIQALKSSLREVHAEQNEIPQEKIEEEITGTYIATINLRFICK